MFVDNETGEVIEENNLPELKKELSLIVTDNILDQYEKVAMLQRELEKWKEEQEEAIKELMKKHGIKSFKNDYVSITYTAPHTRKTLDKKAIEVLLDVKLDDDKFYKTTNVKESLSIKHRELGD